MSDRLKIQLSITSRAAAMLEKHASERKRGEFVSQLLESYELGDVSSTDLELMRLQIVGLAGQLKSHDARLLQIDRQLAALIAKE